MREIYRISIPMKSRTRTALTMLSQATNSSIGQTAGSFLDELAPHFERLAKAYTVARYDPKAAALIISDQADEAIDELCQEQMQLLDSLIKQSKKTAKPDPTDQ